MIQIATFTFNPFGENTYIIYDETREALIVDPGNYDKQEDEELTQFVADNRLQPVLIANTHAHIDHVLGVAFVKNRYGIPFALHPVELPYLRAVKAYAPNYGFATFDEPEVDRELEAGGTIRFGHTELEILFVPGHSAGHVAFLQREQEILLSGDVLFYESIGRTDLPGGDFPTLVASIGSQLFTLDDQVKVYPGHGQPTSIGHEKKHNPFLRGRL